MLLRRSCFRDGATAAIELRSSSSVALILRVASLGRDAQNDENKFIFPCVDLNTKGRGPRS